MRTVPEAFAGPTVVTCDVAKLVAEAEPAELAPALDPELAPEEEAFAVVPLDEVLEGDDPAALDPPDVVEPDVLLTADATALGRPLAAAAFETGPLLVAMIKGA
jgi:hypothetical protein